MTFARDRKPRRVGTRYQAGRLIQLGGFLAFGVAQYALAESASAAAGTGESGSSMVSGLLEDKLVLSVGASRLSGEASVGASLTGLPPEEISLNDLGLDDNDTSFFSELTYRINDRWEVQAAVYGFDVSSSGTADRDFTIGGVDFEVGVELDLGLEIDAYLLHASYTVYDGSRFDLQIGAGIHALDLADSIRSIRSFDEEEVRRQRSSSSLLVPVPNLRAEARWYLTDRLAITGTTGWLSADVDDYEGDFVYLHLQTVYSITSRLGLALGYQRTEIDVTESRLRSRIVYDVLLDGATFTLKWAF